MTPYDLQGFDCFQLKMRIQPPINKIAPVVLLQLNLSFGRQRALTAFFTAAYKSRDTVRQISH